MPGISKAGSENLRPSGRNLTPNKKMVNMNVYRRREIDTSGLFGKKISQNGGNQRTLSTITKLPVEAGI
jgi:hypothetical protein